MANARILHWGTQGLVGLSVFALGLWLAYQVGGKIASNDYRTLEFGLLVVVVTIVAIYIQKDWRLGFYMFIVWLLFEDLVRKYLGNNMVIYFAKDVLIGLVYISFFAAVRNHRERLFRPPFLPFLMVFLWLGIIQIFNQNSPHILYGLLGFKLYFYYIPVMYVSYALIRDDEDLRKFLLTNLFLAGLISVIGIIQAIVGHSFLNPANARAGTSGSRGIGPVFANHKPDANAADGCVCKRRAVWIVSLDRYHLGDRCCGIPAAFQSRQSRICIYRDWPARRRRTVQRLPHGSGIRRRERDRFDCRPPMGRSLALAASPSADQSHT
jgi:hypothetical protein